MGIRFLLLTTAVSFLVVAPAPGGVTGLFGFSFSNIRTTYDGGGLLNTMAWTNTRGDVYRNLSPAGMAVFDNGQWNVGGTVEGFWINLALSNITAATADAVGTLTLKDVEGDTLSGSLSGTWLRSAGGGMLVGTLSDVTYTAVVDGLFEGHRGSASMSFNSWQPWQGSLMEVALLGPWWFSAGQPFDVYGGSVDSTVTGALHCPAPGALVLALAGTMSLAGLRRRRFI